MRQNVTVWFARFLGIGESERFEVISREGVETDKRVTIPNTRQYGGAEMRLEPRKVNRTAKQAIDRAAAYEQAQREHALWILERVERHEALIAAVRASMGIE